LLEKYHKKRNFSSTTEPEGKGKGKITGKPKFKNTGTGKKNLEFVIHQHFASRLHYDLRLELEGVLKSWAVPKEPSLDPAVKRLAVMVEDHPFEYRLFKGTIPEGNYGAGKVNIWDKGTYSALDAANKEESEKILKDGLKKGLLTFILKGKKLKGEFSLVKIPKTSEKNWLLIKKNDKFAQRSN
jgi:bifunctional non-homologous end joining protein LigD